MHETTGINKQEQYTHTYTYVDDIFIIYTIEIRNRMHVFSFCLNS